MTARPFNDPIAEGRGESRGVTTPEDDAVALNVANPLATTNDLVITEAFGCGKILGFCAINRGVTDAVDLTFILNAENPLAATADFVAAEAFG
jgi:hypothetical protein